ncbi:MsnO8 family LLM class oxidoreductase [Streptomyces sp. NPDC058155]|uniref:MsnO8 family LLM class oxidoreductase n=1 Tax=Streptomyces sp. NPDC058155 TaxID=3346359 RepID=UPI0036E79C67
MTSREPAGGCAVPSANPPQLSVLDTSPVTTDRSPSMAVADTVALAKAAETYGYRRFWVAEHHASRGSAGTSPEVLTGIIASATTRMRVGAGGVMLLNHSPFHVAEIFRTLAGVFPGRVDLGVGRAPGGSKEAVRALRAYGERAGATLDDYPAHLSSLLEHLSTGFDDPVQRGAPVAMPDGVCSPPLWLLGSSLHTAEIAGRLGANFAFAGHFKSVDQKMAEAAFEHYRSVAESAGQVPRGSLLTVAAVCARTPAAAERLKAAAVLANVRKQMRIPGLLLNSAEVARHTWSPEEIAVADALAPDTVVSGTPGQVRDALIEVARATGVEEIMINNVIADKDERHRSYKLIADSLRS